MHDESADPLIGSTVDGRYLVLSKVAHGGMSTVYLAKDLRLDRNIALKILPPHLATDADFIGRLRREAQSAASLSHPHVVQIHDHGVGPQHAYLVFEFIDGYTLRDVINQDGPQSPRQALDLLEPVVEGLAAAHEAGLIHRDVKPENVLISHQGWVKIGDFGLSRTVTTSTNTRNLLGTVAYIAPELAQGHGGDARSDIYSAGIMLYELLTGVQPFRSTIPVAVIMSHVQDQVPPPSLVVPGLPADMDDLVRWMTEKEPDKRPSNGTALLEELRHIRTNMTAAELDFDGAPRAVAIDAAHQQATDVVPAPSAHPQDLTAVVQAPNFPTSVLPPSRNLYADDPFADQHDSAVAPNTQTLTKRQASAETKARAKAAATPRTSLGPVKPRRRALLWILLVLLLGAIAGTAGWYLGFGPGALATVPDVHNKSVAQAEEMMLAAGFEHFPTAEVFDETVASGLIVATDPGAGSSVRKFNGITLRVSRGPVLYPVPSVTGKQLEDAKQSLADGHQVVGSVSETYDETVPAGVVLSQDPPAGKEFRGNTKVNLTVSLGPKPIPVPAVAGKSEADARAALKAVGLVAAIAPENVNSTTVPTGSVVSQSPDAGTLKAGDTVTLTLSKGPRMIEVLSFVGKQVGVATKALEGLGFEVKVENILGGFFGTVRVQTPDGGQAPEGSTIVLKVV